ncbi:uncharacterized protein ALTATR162_LOCUS6386 [Alternaria atra]|uniref:MARVEL domain-containing protein n=1 Tax=Alternaria atra TaxID=119953 RepID=A0A8J2I2W0_9PLEO|nr:uncharacterized protein ALTATR162_LOCUS6386 [Alternaria atra]CAG5163218.1 unnamed protein product [Alternaria atra]
MAIFSADNRPLNLVVRALQIVLAIVVIGTVGYAINGYHVHDSVAHTPTGDFDVTVGAPNSWGFLLFCAAWTILVVIFQLVSGGTFGEHPLIGYIRVGVEIVAVLSWFAGWIAAAANIGTSACSADHGSCSAIKAGTAFAALTWLLFMFTTAMTISLFNNRKRHPVHHTTSQTAHV